MVMCCVPGCTNVHAKGKKYLKFFRFPSAQVERQTWLKQLGLDDVSPNARICSRHFPSGTKSPAGLLPTISKEYRRKPAVSVPATKRCSVTVSFTWSPLKQTPLSKRFARVTSRPKRPKFSTPTMLLEQAGGLFVFL